MSILFTSYLLYLWLMSTMAMPIYLPHFRTPTLPKWDIQRGPDFNALVHMDLKDKERGSGASDKRIVVEVKTKTKRDKAEKKKDGKKLWVGEMPSPGIQCAVM